MKMIDSWSKMSQNESVKRRRLAVRSRDKGRIDHDKSRIDHNGQIDENRVESNMVEIMVKSIKQVRTAEQRTHLLLEEDRKDSLLCVCVCVCVCVLCVCVWRVGAIL